MSDADRFIARAIEISREALGKPGCNPFGAVVVRNGEIVGEGLNHSLAHFDPTSHGETEAIRDACRRLQCLELSDCDLYSSCEPCSLCVATMEMVGIRKLYYAASLPQSAKAFADAGLVRIDTDRMRAEVGKPVGERMMPAEQIGTAQAVDVLTAWAAARKAS